MVANWRALAAEVSIHAPAWGATPTAPGRQPPSGCFNPRPRMGGDQANSTDSGGMTCFNPRPRMGGDTTGSIARVENGTFQSTPPHGGRLGLTWPTGNLSLMFQSTPPHGGRPDHRGQHGPRGTVSIHAPAWGATHLLSFLQNVESVSIHAPAWGATCCRWISNG